MKQLYQILVVIDDHADSPALHKKTGDAALDTLFIRGRHFQILTIVSTQKLRLISNNAVRVNSQFFMVWAPAQSVRKGQPAGGADSSRAEDGPGGDV